MVAATIIKVYKFHAAGERTKLIGKLYSDGVFRKDVVPGIHQLFSPPAWCIDAPTFEDVERRAKSIRLYDTQNKVTWIISPGYFREHCGEIDRGHGKQYFCPLKWWQSVTSKKWELVTAPQTEEVKQKRLL